MIIFLFGSWGSGKSYVGDMIKDKAGLQHMEADLYFDREMVWALRDRSYHTLDLNTYYSKVMMEIRSFSRISTNVIVSQAVYREEYRVFLQNALGPDIRFVWVKTPDRMLQKGRINTRSSQGNPITPDVWEYMQAHWEDPQLPHEVILNNDDVEVQIPEVLASCGVFVHWDDGEDDDYY